MPEHGDSTLHEGGLSEHLRYTIMLAAQANRRRPRDDTKGAFMPRQPERISLVTWLLFDAVLLAYGLAALILLRVVSL